MAKINIKFNNKTYSINPASLADATATLEAHLMGMMEERLEGDGAEFHKFAPAALTFRSTAPLSELQEVQINGVAVDPSNYTTEEGSTVITLPIEYLKTLDVDNYEISVVSASKSVKGGFSVVAPELNEHGFYYNQPYTAYVAPLGVNLAVFLREGGVADIINIDYQQNNEKGTYVVDENSLSVTCSLGTLDCAASNNGTEIFCTQLGTAFALNSNNIVADYDYLYIYDNSLGGYIVSCIDKTQSSYGAIKTDINGIDTIRLADEMFAENENLIVAPYIPNSVTVISDGAFMNCTNLTNIIMPEDVTVIEARAFQRCFGLNSVTIPDKVATIGDSAFYWCEFTSVNIPLSVTQIGAAFDNCTNLATITFEGTIEQWNAIDKNDWWNYNVPATHVHCIDGDVAL